MYCKILYNVVLYNCSKEQRKKRKGDEQKWQVYFFEGKKYKILGIGNITDKNFRFLEKR